MWPEILDRFIMIFTSLLVIVEPLGVIPTYLGLTHRLDAGESRKVALKASLFGAFVLIVFSLVGNYIFLFLQINLAAFKAAGGVLLFLTALDMLRASRDDCRCSQAEKRSSAEGHDISFVPLGIPLLAGPGAITTVMVFSRDHNEGHLYQFGVLLLAISLVFILSYIALKYAQRLKQLMGESGMTVVQRIMGLMLAAISLQFIFSGALVLLKMERI